RRKLEELHSPPLAARIGVGPVAIEGEVAQHGGRKGEGVGDHGPEVEDLDQQREDAKIDDKADRAYDQKLEEALGFPLLDATVADDIDKQSHHPTTSTERPARDACRAGDNPISMPNIAPRCK